MVKMIGGLMHDPMVKYYAERWGLPLLADSNGPSLGETFEDWTLI
jgi:hypothetical protein